MCFLRRAAQRRIMLEAMLKKRFVLISAALLFAPLAPNRYAGQARPAQSHSRPAKAASAEPWKFAVSGDSRNCGDVVMPGIAAGVRKSGAAFYWHLGDFRKITDVDEDIQHQPEHLVLSAIAAAAKRRGTASYWRLGDFRINDVGENIQPKPEHPAKALSLPEYEKIAWTDFIENQLMPFGSLPVYLAIGNHEMVAPRTRPEYVAQFHRWLDTPQLRTQRLHDDPSATEPRTYYHWIEHGVDFIALDNATKDEFDEVQLSWLEKTLQTDAANARIRTLVVGMHEALPESISANHSMDESPTGIVTGRRVYADLLNAQNDNGKRVYVLASHSHYFMDGIFNTEYWRTHGGILPGWIIGTAGAERYALPEDAKDARAAETNVYGYLLATVSLQGEIQFDFRRLSEQDIPAAVMQRYTPDFVRWCFAENSSAR
jgi:hypothetical protein